MNNEDRWLQAQQQRHAEAQGRSHDVAGQLLGAAEAIASQVVNATPIDLTVTAKIVQVRNVEIGEYRVRHQGNTMSAFSLDPLTVYRVGEDVYMLVPRGDFSAKKIILGQSRWDSGTSFADRHAMMNQWMPVGPNWLSQEWYWRNAQHQGRTDPRDQGIIAIAPHQITSVLAMTSVVADRPTHPAWRGDLFVRNSNQYTAHREIPGPSGDENDRIRPPVAQMRLGTATEAGIRDIDEIFVAHGNMVDHFRIRADFQTTFSATQTSGEYGLIVECLINNPQWPIRNSLPPEMHPVHEFIIQTFRFPCTGFNGNPYALTEPTPQEMIFSIPRGALRGLVRVSLYQDDNFVTDINPGYNFQGGSNVSWMPPDGGATWVFNRNNIHVTNVQIHFVQQINLDNSLYWIRVDAPHGLDIWSGGGGRENPAALLQARLMYGSNDITSEETCKFYWFREKVDATSMQTRTGNITRDHDEFGNNWHDYGGDGWAPIAWPYPNDRNRVGLAYRTFNVDGEPDNAAFGQWPGPDSGVGAAAARRANYTVQALNNPRSNAVLSAAGLPNNFDIPATSTDRRAGFNELWVPVETVPWRWRFKVVCVYNGTRTDAPRGQRNESPTKIITNEGRDPHFLSSTVRNARSQFDFEISGAHAGLGGDNQFLRLINYAHPWLDQPPFDETIDPVVNRDWWGRWWFIGTNGQMIIYEPDGAILNQYRRGRVRVNPFLNETIMEFAVQIYAPIRTGAPWLPNPPVGPAPSIANFPVVPTAAQQEQEFTEIGVARLTLLAPGENPFYVEFTGDKSFNYDANGVSHLADWERMRTVNARIFWREQQAGAYSVQWIAQDGITPVTQGEVGARLAEGFGINDPLSMMTGVWSPTFGSLNNRNSLHFHIREYYEQPTRPNNTFIFRIRLYDGRVFDERVTIEFNRDGSSGTNGTPWAVNVRAVNSGNDNDQVNAVRFHRRLYEPRPLQLTGTFPAPGNAHLTGSGARQLWIRPFITKNGVPLEMLNPQEEYNAQITWDARYAPRANDRSSCDTVDSTMAQASGQTFLHLQQAGAGQSGTNFNMDWYPRGPSPAFSLLSPETLFNNACVRVTWAGNTSLSLASVHHACVVRVRVDIFKGRSPREHVTTIFAYYPVELLFRGSATVDIDPNLMYVRWPKYVDYDSAGYNPRLDVGQEIWFKYGNDVRNPHPPLPVSAVPVNSNRRLAGIVERPVGERAWNYEPAPHFLAFEWIYDSIRTQIDLVAAGSNNFAGWGNATFVRPVIYRLTTHGNATINAWDGQVLIPGVTGPASGQALLAPMVGAGWMNPGTNTFTGVIMGINTGKMKTPHVGGANSVYGGFPGEVSGFANPFQATPGSQFMTGLFGYQNGISSFGIMENGIAYFGRADRGRIVIDGVNAQIYGGGSLFLGVGAYGNDGNGRGVMPMWNRMRLSFIDFTGAANSRDPANYEPGNDMQLTPGPSIDGCSDVNIALGPLHVNNLFRFFFNADQGSDRSGGFGHGTGYATPAIEIGQYDPLTHRIRELTIAEIRQGANFGNITGLHIPGNRRFLVTYDGTMYAMNAFIRGNIVGSNIIGAQFYNAGGTFAVTVDGNLGVGHNQWGAGWLTQVVNNGYSERWSHQMPNTFGFDVRNRLPEANRQRADFIDGQYQFYVSNSGIVICREIHVLGGSLSIGNFHIIGRRNWDDPVWGPGADGWRSGDVVSFGTMYLVGAQQTNSGTPPLHLPYNALEGWGNVFLRGRLTNLGPVFLGGSLEKLATTGAPPQPGVAATNVAGPMNSPFSVFPTIGSPGTLDPRAQFPVQSGLWPLYARVGATAGVEQTNDVWICISGNSAVAVNQNNGYMPAFNLRPGATAAHGPIIIPEEPGVGFAQMSRHVVWRIDQLGQWTDGLMFTRTAWASLPNDQTAYTANHALLYMGWGDIPWWSGDTRVDVFMIRNVSAMAPNTVIEAPSAIRISAGRYFRRGQATSRDLRASVIIDSYDNTATGQQAGYRKGMVVVNGQHDIAAMSAASVMISGRNPDRIGGGGQPADINAYISFNAIGWDNNVLVHDERGFIAQSFPFRAAEADNGYIWIKARTIINDAESGTTNNHIPQNTNSANAQVRLNRTASGGPEDYSTPVAAVPAENFATAAVRTPIVAGVGRVLLGHLTLRSDHGVNLWATASTGFVRISLGNISGGGTRTIMLVNEGIYIGHNNTHGISLRSNALRVHGYTAEQQHGIYARFA